MSVQTPASPGPTVVTPAALEALVRRVVREEFGRVGQLLAAAAQPEAAPAGASGLTLGAYRALPIPALFDRIAATTTGVALRDLEDLERHLPLPRATVLTAIDIRREEVDRVAAAPIGAP